MRRSEINALIRHAAACFQAHGWALPPKPRWDVTDFGLGDHTEHGLVLVNLAEEPEYCEKLMYARRGMRTPAHHHLKKKEDIICRWGELHVKVWNKDGQSVQVKVNGVPCVFDPGALVRLTAGERITLEPGVIHEFEPASEECIIGEVSTANDDLNDNIFQNANVGRFPGIEEDEVPLVPLVSDS